MNWRAGLALSVLAFVAGAVAVSWLSSAGLNLWDNQEPQVAPVVPIDSHAVAPATPLPVHPASPAPSLAPPVADSARTEAMLVAMASRRAIEAGIALGDLEPRLNAAFSQVQPQALATVVAADEDRLTTARLLAELDRIEPQLQRESGSSWEQLQREVSNMFVLRKSDAAPSGPDAQFARARDLLASGNVEGALRFVGTMPGAAHAQKWVAKARRYLATQRALDALERAALTMPLATPVAVPVMPQASPADPLPPADPVP